ncbi:hypothetical protein F4703DRAFT_1343594 [Phycomyces blakesleeanus]
MSSLTRFVQSIGIRRNFSTAVPETSRLIYASNNSGLVKLIKLFSVSTLGISSAATPAVMYFWDSPAVQATELSGYMFLGALAASTCSTGALHFMLSPYVHTIQLHSPPRKTVTAADTITPNSVVTLETLDMFARKRETTLALRDLVPNPGMFSTWKVSKKVLNRQFELERVKGIPPTIHQDKFWLDQRDARGDGPVMANLIRVVEEHDRRQRLI